MNRRGVFLRAATAREWQRWRRCHSLAVAARKNTAFRSNTPSPERGVGRGWVSKTHDITPYRHLTRGAVSLHRQQFVFLREGLQ